MKFPTLFVFDMVMRLPSIADWWGLRLEQKHYRYLELGFELLDSGA